MMTSTMRWQVLARAATGAGKIAFSSEPSSATISGNIEHALVVRYVRIEQRFSV